MEHQESRGGLVSEECGSTTTERQPDVAQPIFQTLRGLEAQLMRIGDTRG